MYKDRIAGSAKVMKGSAKEAIGKVTGDAKLATEGKADKVEGKVQNAIGGVKDVVRACFPRTGRRHLARPYSAPQPWRAICWVGRDRTPRPYSSSLRLGSSARAAHLVGGNMTAGKIEGRRLDAERACARRHVAEHVITFSRAPALDVAQHRCLHRRARFRKEPNAGIHECLSGLET